MLQSTLSRRAARVRTWTRAQSTVASLWPQWPSRWLAYQRPDAVSAQAALQVGVDPAIDADVMSPPTLIAALIDAAHIVSGASWLAAGVGVTLALRCALLPTSMRGTLLQTMLRTLTPEATVRFRGARDAFLKRDREGLRYWISAIKVFNFDHQRVLSPLNHLFHPALLVFTAASNIWAIRYLCATMPTMQHESFLWIHDFSARSINVDPSLKLPLICATVQFASLAVAAWPQLRPSVPLEAATVLPPTVAAPAAVRAPTNRALKRKAGVAAVAPPTTAAAASTVVVTPPRASRVTKAIIGVSFAFNVLFTIISPFFPQGVLLMHWLPSSLFGLAHMLGMRYASSLPSFRKWVTSRPTVAYAQAAAVYWHNNPLRPLDFEQLKQRPLLKKVKEQ